ncbi:MAG: NAD(P)-dependent oxidoreductase [Candidatus Korobacteraceae bacterium]|jgi:nucleoside-diphosphate-sugar epimerase
MDKKSLRILITGGRGFLGVYLTRELLKAGHKVILFDVPQAGEQAPVEGAEVITADICDYNAVLSAVTESRPDVIVHAAAIVGGVLSMTQPAITVKVNLEGTIHILEAMRARAVPRAFLISSEEVYGSFDYDPVDEGHPLRPCTPYGITKAAAERYADYYRARYGVQMFHARTSWVYGAGMPRLMRFETQLILDALKTGEAFAPCGADHRIDYTHVDDFADGLKRLIEAPRLNYHAYNLATGRALRLDDLASVLASYIPGSRISVGKGLLEFAPGFPAPIKGALNIGRIRQEVGYEPRVPVEAGMRRYVDELRRALSESTLRGVSVQA